MLEKMPKMEIIETNRPSPTRITKTFQLTKVSLRLLMFQVKNNKFFYHFFLN